MSAPWSDRNLLLGIVALQMDFISRDGLIAAMQQWTLDKARSLAEILERNGELDPFDRGALEILVERHIAHHGGDPEKSLSAVDVVGSARATLESLCDPDIHESLSKLGSTHEDVAERNDPDGTISWRTAAGEPGGRFRILHLHDQGGLGNVFKARDCEVNRDVALKEEIATDPQSRARFVFEAEITGNLEHPGIVPLYGKGEYSDGRPYYAMRFIHGDNLKIAVDQLHKASLDAGARRREFQKLLRRYLVVCETMSYAHSRGIIHRDLKPRNILLGPYGETLVVDWGLAKVVGHKEAHPPTDATLRPPSSSDIQPTTAGSRVGTPAYMSPEQARGEVESLGPAADIYSLGATLYYMLVGRAPFTEQEVAEILLKVERGEFPRPREVRPGVDRALEAICLKAMALHPRDRYASCRVLADDLERWLADQPVSAYPEPLARLVLRWGRRHRLLLAGVTALVFLSFVGLGLHDWSIGQEKARVETALDKLGEAHLATGKARDEAARHLETIRNALRRQFLLAANSLGQFPQTEPLRERLARDLVNSYEPLLKSYPDNPYLVFDAGEAYRILGTSCRRTGKLHDALSSYQRSLALYESILDRPERRFAARRGLVNVLSDLGEFHLIEGGRKLAEQHLRRASDEAEPLQSDPDTFFYVRLKSTALRVISSVARGRGVFEDARLLADQAVVLLGKPVDKAPDSWPDEVRWLLALALHERGLAHGEVKNANGARDDFERALNVARAIPERSPYFRDAQHAVAVVSRSLGEHLGHVGGGAGDAEPPLDRSVSILDSYARDEPEKQEYTEDLCASLLARCVIRLAANRLPDAGADARRAITIATELHKLVPQNPEYFSLLGRATALEGEIARRRGDTNLARRRQAEGAAFLKQAVSIDPERSLDRKYLETIPKD
jgi:eukaryotic-like serine/threonine-protein kinase